MSMPCLVYIQRRANLQLFSRVSAEDTINSLNCLFFLLTSPLGIHCHCFLSLLIKCTVFIVVIDMQFVDFISFFLHFLIFAVEEWVGMSKRNIKQNTLPLHRDITQSAPTPHTCTHMHISICYGQMHWMQKATLQWTSVLPLAFELEAFIVRGSAAWLS